MPRFSLNLFYYPLNLGSVKDQTISDIHISSSNDITKVYKDSDDTYFLPEGFTDFLFQPWNYSQNFDYVENNSITKKMITSFTASNNLFTPDTPLTDCPANCDQCNSKECYLCAADYYLSAGVCIQPIATTYYFLSPAFLPNTKTPTDLEFQQFSPLSTSFSVSFFVKVLGWNTSSPSFDLFRYGTGLKLRYVIAAKSLELYTGSNVVISTYANFYPLLGTWVQISMSYFFDDNVKAYYPPIMNFQVNFVQTVVSNGIDIHNLSVNNVVIPKESIAIYAKLWIWNGKYITGTWGLQANTDDTILNATKFIDYPLTKTACITNGATLVATVDYTCVLDYDKLLDKNNYCSGATNASFVDNRAVCLAKNSNCPYGMYGTAPSNACSCEMAVLDMFVDKNNGITVCKKLEYLDFLRNTSPLLINNISYGTTEYSIDMWVYMNNYVSDQFNTYEVRWDKQLSIKISYSSGFKSTCYPVYDSTNSPLTAQNTNQININPTRWAYVRCGIDLTNSKYYHLSENGSFTENTLIISPITPPTVSANTTLEFYHDSLNRGVLFFRQIRLWKCYKCQEADSHSLYLTSTSAALHTLLLHAWDPIYNSAGTVDDLKTAANTITLTKDTNWIGYNMLDLSHYYDLIPTQISNFAVFPEDSTIIKDFIYTPNETFYGAWYFADSSNTNNIEDKTNGIKIQPFSDVNTIFNFSVLSILLLLIDLLTILQRLQFL